MGRSSDARARMNAGAIRSCTESRQEGIRGRITDCRAGWLFGQRLFTTSGNSCYHRTSIFGKGELPPREPGSFYKGFPPWGFCRGPMRTQRENSLLRLPFEGWLFQLKKGTPAKIGNHKEGVRLFYHPHFARTPFCMDSRAIRGASARPRRSSARSTPEHWRAGPECTAFDR